ncbi:hypothetical protein [Haladaptatus sp. DYF46]|uniref:hypothetical protein n=1 Tax=Haladaptatus sp. DYF46 TaxID=2886041 RepID=UPI001E3BB998|nr:hypothetical protein [Haladaptatus sp. DYF46]
MSSDQSHKKKANVETSPETAETLTTDSDSTRKSNAGESVGRAFDSARERLSQPGPRAQLEFIIGLFAVIGAGFGLTGVVAIQMVAGGNSGIGGQILAGIFLISLLVVLLLIGPIVGGFGGLRVAEQLAEGRHTVYLTSFVGNAVGYVVMVIVSALLIGLFAGGGGGGSGSPFSITDLLIPLIILALPVGLTGVGASYLVLRKGR